MYGWIDVIMDGMGWNGWIDGWMDMGRWMDLGESSWMDAEQARNRNRIETNQ